MYFILEQFINKLEQKLKEPLPGLDAQYIMAPVKREKYDLSQLSNYKESAVLILLCGDEKEKIFIPLTERFAYDGVHSGQVSFPGGKKDDDDFDLQTTALRECEEEIGIQRSQVRILGMLTKLYIPVSNFMVTPVLAVCPEKDPMITKNPREVKSVLHLYLDDLLNENSVNEGVVGQRNNQNIKAPYFLVEGLKVWGATAMMLSELKTLLKTIS